MSLADVKLLIAVDIIVAVTGAEFVSEELTPAIWAVYKTVNAIPSMVQWKNSNEYKLNEEASKPILTV